MFIHVQHVLLSLNNFSGNVLEYLLVLARIAIQGFTYFHTNIR